MEEEEETAEKRGEDEEETEFLFARSILFTVSRYSSSRSVSVGKFLAGRLTLSSDVLFDALPSFFLHSEDPLNEEDGKYSILCKIEPKSKKKVPAWKTYVQKAGTLEATPQFNEFYDLIGEFKNFMRPTFVLSENQLFIYIMTKPDSISTDLHSAVANLHAINSVTPSLHAQVITWNKLMKLAYPEKADLFACRASLPSLDPPVREDFDEFFEKVRFRRRAPKAYPLSLERLTCTLRPYQMEAARFMIDRELNTEIQMGEDNFFNVVPISGGLFYFTHFGVFCRNADVSSCAVTGGILADEMGLGKTVELLALIFSLRPDNLEKMKKNIHREPRSITPDPDPVRETVEYLVSSIVATEEGTKGLEAILKSRMISKSERNRNVYFNVNARNLLKDESIQKMPQIVCSDCGTSCLRDHMHWKKEYDEEGIPFVCPDCVYQGPVLPSGATLIVLPQVLCHQWFEEIRKHVREDVLIDVYMGVEKDGYKHPVYLSRCDIVIASYETLRAELGFISVGTKHNLRKRTYEMQRVVTSPLLRIHWWRVCLDESQLVESRGSQAAQMCGKLHSRARWCVTGTPLIHSVDDLFGLVGFLELYPFNQKNVWKTQMWNNYIQGRQESLLHFVAQFFWRNSVSNVKDQLGLPPVKHEVTELAFSPLEERLYQEKLCSSLERLREYLRNLNYDRTTLLSNLSDAQQHQLLGILNEIRLFILTGGAHLKMTKKEIEQREVPYSPELLFRRLFLTQKIKMEQKTREYVYSICALSGMLNLYHPSKATDSYLKIFEIEKNLEKLNVTFAQNEVLMDKPLRVDKTQLYHVCQALIDIHKDTSAPDSVDIPLLKARMFDLSERYMNREMITLAKLRGDWAAILRSWSFYDRAFDSCTSWMQFYLDRMPLEQATGIRNWAAELELIYSPEIDHLIKHYPAREFPLRLFFFIQDKFERQQGDLTELRIKLNQIAFDCVKDGGILSDPTSPEFLQMMNCHHNILYIHSEEFERNAEEENLLLNEPRAKRNPMALTFDAENDENELSCAVCEMEKCAQKLERSLFITDGTIISRRLTLDENELYRLCKEISYKRVAGAHFSPHIRNLWKWFELGRKTVLLCNKIIVAVKEIVCRYRELRQAARRLEFGMELEMPGFLSQRIVLPPQETSGVTRAINLWNRRCEEGKVQISRVTTQIMYINTLKNNNEDTVRECPVCYSEVTRSWHVFPCAHLICHSCFKQLKLNSVNPLRNRQVVSCVTCRAECAFDGVSLVVEEAPSAEDDDDDMPNMKLTVKYDAILRKMKKILRADPTNKILIFTSLTEALDSFCELLSAVNIVHRRLTTLDPIRIADFRNDPKIRVLIMSLHIGANGLNLTQANHIFFLEPTTEKSTVAQAIGRMARMGQHRSMTVHNFVVMGSVEEEVQRLVANAVSDEGWTIDQLDHMLSFGANALG